MKKLLGLFVTVAMLGFAAPAFACGGAECGCQKAQEANADEETDEPSLDSDTEPTTEAELNIEGMSCAQCAKHLARTLQTLEGVVESNVSLTDEKATIRYDADQVDPESVVDEIESTHNGKFDAELLSQAPINS